MVRFHMVIGDGDQPLTYQPIVFRLPHWAPWRQELIVRLTGIYPHEQAARQAAYRWVNEAARQEREALAAAAAEDVA